MLARLAAAIARALTALAKAPFDLLDWAWGSVFGRGGGSPSTPPEFQPDTEVADLVERLQTSRRRSEVEMRAHQDAVGIVRKYLQAPTSLRPMIDLSGLPTPLRTMLLDMSPEELSALSSAGLSAVRKFVDGKVHNVEGVPAVPSAPVPKAPHQPMSARERLAHKIRSQQLKDQFSEPYTDPRVSTM